jgi:hypothetical protein
MVLVAAGILAEVGTPNVGARDVGIALGIGGDLGDVEFDAGDLESPSEVEAQQRAPLEGLDSRPPSVRRPSAEAACQGWQKTLVVPHGCAILG